MNILYIMIIVFVAFISISTIIRHNRRRKKEDSEYQSQIKYKRRISSSGSSRRIKSEGANSIKKVNKTDYREPASKKQDYSDWGS